MQNVRRLPIAGNVDTEAECLYRYVSGAKDTFNPHSHSFYEIFITVNGTVSHFINGVTQSLPEGTLVFIRPDDIHGYVYDSPKNRDTSYINLTFTYETAKLLFSYLSNDFPAEKLLSCDMPPAVILSKVEKERLLRQIGELNLVNWKDKKALKIRMRMLLCDIFVAFFSSALNYAESKIPVWLSKLILDMESPENFLIGTEQMTVLSHKSREHIARSMKKYLGVSPTEYINELKLNYASNRLLHTCDPVISICYDAGFQNVSYFNRVFKRKYGVSPKEFRNTYK